MTEEQSVAKAPSKSLTIKPNRLAGSENCLNCSTPLQGPFCHYCGQPDKRLIRFFPVLIREFFEDFLELDTRFTRTMKPLLFQPGRLSRDYLDGRRFRYTTPMRLFIFSSMLFFILAATLASNAIEVGDVRFNGNDDFDIATLQENPELAEALSEADWEKVEEEVEKQKALAAEAWAEARDNSAPDEPDEPEDNDLHFQFNDEEWDRETNPLIIPILPDSINDWINDEIEKSPQKAEEIEQNPNLIIDKVFELLPATMFIMLPFVALLLKFWYLFAKKYYVEHLIHALHNHAFLFVVLTITLLNNALIDWRDPAGESAFWQSMSWINVAIYIWIPIYLLISLRTVYGQNWILTIFKYGAIGISYFVLLTFVTTVVALLGFLLL
jgi:hypothetical protein